MGISRSSFSCEGRDRRDLSAGPQFMGVEVRVTSPAFCGTRV